MRAEGARDSAAEGSEPGYLHGGTQAELARLRARVAELEQIRERQGARIRALVGAIRDLAPACERAGRVAEGE